MFRFVSWLIAGVLTFQFASARPAFAQPARPIMMTPMRTPSLIGVAVNNPVAASATPTGSVNALTVSSLANQAINPNLLLAPNLTLPQAAFNTVTLGQAVSQVSPYALGFNPYAQSLYSGVAYPLGAGLYGGGYGGYSSTMTGQYGGQGSSSPYSGSSGYPEDPSAAYLRGASTYTNSDGRYLGHVQQARLSQTQADSARLDLRKRTADERALERKDWLDPEAERVKDIQTAYNRATLEPPITEILSGRALNDLYNHVYPLQDRGKLHDRTCPDVPLDPEMLKQANLTGVASAGSFAMLKDRGRLTWPRALQGPEYAAYRDKLTTLAADAVEQVRLGQPVGSVAIRDMGDELRRMNRTLFGKAGELSSADYISAKQFLVALESAVRSLRDPNLGSFLNLSGETRARNVAELVELMGRKGLRFAPATPGDEPAYRHLYQRILAYDRRMAELAAKP